MPEAIRNVVDLFVQEIRNVLGEDGLDLCHCAACITWYVLGDCGIYRTMAMAE
jgi:hypothetical protein